jgi:putative hydrolase of the HAD superfamily
MDDVSTVASELGRIDRNGYNVDRAADLNAHQAWLVSPGVDAIAAHWDRHFVACTQAREGLTTTIDALAQAGVQLGVITNGATAKQRRKLEMLELWNRLGAVLISEDFGAAKPDARIFHAAAQRLGVDPSECVFVGDNPQKDVLGAAAAGMRAVWFRATVPWPEGLPPAQESVRSLAEVLDLPGLDRLR